MTSVPLGILVATLDELAVGVKREWSGRAIGSQARFCASGTDDVPPIRQRRQRRRRISVNPDGGREICLENGASASHRWLASGVLEWQQVLLRIHDRDSVRAQR